ncbi:MAG: hypothetical protein AAGJ08_10315 [Cyanobacteria bacterium P01_H01_bin.35]
MIWNPFSKDSSEGDKKITLDEVHLILAQFQEWMPRIQVLPELQPELKYDEIIKYFDSDCPPNSTVTKGAIICQKRPRGQLLGLIFLDENNRFVCRPDGTPYGRQLLGEKLDKKLSKNFGSLDLIIVELKSQKSGVAQFHQEVVSQFSEWLQDFLKMAEVIPVMTYEDAIQYFITSRPSDPRVQKGGILRQPHPQGQFLAQMFLDNNDQIVHRPDGKPYGRYLVAKQLDEELQDTFGKQDLIIVE